MASTAGKSAGCTETLAISAITLPGSVAGLTMQQSETLFPSQHSLCVFISTDFSLPQQKCSCSDNPEEPRENRHKRHMERIRVIDEANLRNFEIRMAIWKGFSQII